MEIENFNKIKEQLEGISGFLHRIGTSLPGTSEQPHPLTRAISLTVDSIHSYFSLLYEAKTSQDISQIKLIKALEGLLKEIDSTLIKIFEHNLISNEQQEYLQNATILCEDIKSKIVRKGSHVFLKTSSETRPELKATDISIQFNNRLQKLEMAFEVTQEDRDKLDELLKKAEAVVAALEEKIPSLEKKYEAELRKVDELFKERSEYLSIKQTEIDNSFSIAAGRILAGGYDIHAAIEKKEANWLRWGALGCLAIIIALVGYTAFETTQDLFSFEASMLRLVFSLILSVPAAYLARESAKHRQQQYNFLQTSLDLNAMGPYLASLPEEDQHKLKAKIAGKLFAARKDKATDTEPFPINSQELIVRILDRLEQLDRKESNSKKQEP